jgi:hypothetical protein
MRTTPRFRAPGHPQCSSGPVCQSILYLCTIAIAAFTVSASPLHADDQPPQQPSPMRAILDAGAYGSAAHALMATIDRPTLVASSEPDCGFLITAIAQGSQAERLGITPGSRFLALDGRFLPATADLGFYQLRTDKPQQITVWSAGLGERSLTIQPGPIGLTWENRPWRSSLTYLHDSHRQKTFDDDMLVACLAEDNVDLRETALAHVRDAGGHPTPWYSLASWVASARGQYEDAIAYGHLALDRETDRSATWRIGSGIVNAALACDDVAEARTVMERYWVGPLPTMALNALIPLLDARLAWLKAHAHERSPAPATPAIPLKAQGAALIDVSDRLLCLGDRGQRATESIHKDRSLTFKVPQDRRFTCPLGPLGHDGSFSCTIRYDRTPGKGNAAQTFAGFGVSCIDDAGKTVFLCQANINESPFGMTTISQPDKPVCLVHPAAANGPNIDNHVRITAIADCVECEINGITVYRSAIDNPANRKIACFLMLQEATGTCTDVCWRIDAPSAASAPPYHPAPPPTKAGADDF